MIFFDTETTGLPVRGCVDPALQPRIVEIAAIKVNEALEEVGRFETLVNPGCALPEEAAKLYDITDAMLVGAPPFATVLHEHILPFWLGERTVVAYKVDFDLELMYWELRRLGWEHRFPYCYDIVDAIQHRAGKRISLDKWSAEVLGEAYTKQTHRAMGDVERLLECYRSLKSEGD